jgi:phosphatidylglycerol:prolipoprotein diacylglycerol transferase
MSPGRVADLGVPAVAFAFGLARLGCFLEGCCYGTESSLPWAVRFPGDSPVAAHQVIEGRLAPGTAASLPVHPLQLYFALLAVGCGLVTLALRGHTAYAGQLTLIFVMLHEGGKALLEVLRAPDPLNGGTDLQAVSALLALLALGGLAAGWFLRSTRPGSVRQDAVRD